MSMIFCLVIYRFFFGILSLDHCCAVNCGIKRKIQSNLVTTSFSELNFFVKFKKSYYMYD